MNKPEFRYNSISVQRLYSLSQFNVQNWNNIINILVAQANNNTKCIEVEHYTLNESITELDNRLMNKINSIDLTNPNLPLTEEEKQTIRDNIGMVTPILDYNKAINKPTIEGLPIVGNMVEQYVIKNLLRVLPVVSDTEPDPNDAVIWFDTSESEEQEDKQDETEQMESYTFIADKSIKTQQIDDGVELICEDEEYSFTPDNEFDEYITDNNYQDDEEYTFSPEDDEEIYVFEQDN